MDVIAPRLWLLTGGRGVGKTTFCHQAVGLARRCAWQVAGLLSPALFEDGVKTGILVEDLRSGEQRILGSSSPGFPCNLPVGRWHFDPTSIAWGEEVLAHSLPSDLFIVDELGGLELEQGEGWASALRLLNAGKYRHALLVVRPELVAKARDLVPVHEVIEVQPGIPVPEQVEKWWHMVGGE